MECQEQLSFQFDDVRVPRARHHPKLHHPDPSGFWNLVRTGEKLPKVGDEVLYVRDIRGTNDEYMHNLLVKISDGDPYKSSELREKIENGKKVYEHEVMIAEMLKLPTKAYTPCAKVGIVEDVGHDKVLDEWYIAIKADRGWPPLSIDTDQIIYWAPMPTAPDTYTAREYHPSFVWSAHEARHREVRVQDYLWTRRHRGQQEE